MSGGAEMLQKKAFIKVLQDRSIKEAKESRNRVKKNRMLGPLDGVPCAWKDLFDVKDHATSAGSKLLVNNIAQKDAEILQISKHAGQIFLGKTSTVEFALGGIGTNKKAAEQHAAQYAIEALDR